jgi:hypothetical protein
MPDAANIEIGRKDALPRSCPRCERVALILFRLSAGKIEQARVGCLCRSVVVAPDASRRDQPAYQHSRRSHLV